MKYYLFIIIILKHKMIIIILIKILLMPYHALYIINVIDLTFIIMESISYINFI